jgi:hypothetical protein
VTAATIFNAVDDFASFSDAVIDSYLLVTGWDYFGFNQSFAVGTVFYCHWKSPSYMNGKGMTLIRVSPFIWQLFNFSSKSHKKMHFFLKS